jgi:aconitate hydratase
MYQSDQTQDTLSVQGKEYTFFSLNKAAALGLGDISRLPLSLKILLENQLRHYDNQTVTTASIDAFASWLKDPESTTELAYRPVRVLMQDFTGVPAIVDLAAMRDAMVALGQDPNKINPQCPVDLVIDHSVQVDSAGEAAALVHNVKTEMKRNAARYAFLKWGQHTFSHLQVVPPGTGICHQVNLERLGQTIWSHTQDGKHFAYPDTVVGTDSHTTMINGLGILGWGVGGIEAEAAMLGQPISMLIPKVTGFSLSGKLQAGVTATDLVLTLTEMLRAHGVVGRFVEFYGPGLSALSLADRATIANMAPEYGATCGLFPIDQETLRFLTLTNRSEETIALVEAYAKAQGLFHDEHTPTPVFTDTLSLDLSTVEPSVAGPKRPQDRVPLSQMKATTNALLSEAQQDANTAYTTADDLPLHPGDVVIAAITSCTNTSNPSVMLAAGLLAKKAVEAGLNKPKQVKSSLAPGSKVVTAYLAETGLLPYLEQIGFHVVGYGCTTCIGNSGPLSPTITDTIEENNMMVSAVLSGNRNFEGRVHPLTQANWLASPPLVIAYALAGTTAIDFTTDPIGTGPNGQAVFLKDIWPSSEEINTALNQVKQSMFAEEYAGLFEGDASWQAIPVTPSNTYDFDPASDYIQSPPFFEGLTLEVPPIADIHAARILALLGDSITTDHISPAGMIGLDTPAGQYLHEKGIPQNDFNAYGARRGNHEVMMRGTFANIRIRNRITPDHEGGYTRCFIDNRICSIYEAAMDYRAHGIAQVVIAGSEYGTGSSRDWAAKGPALLGVKAVIAKSFERIHRSNLIGMGILPLTFAVGDSQESLGLTGAETISITDLASVLTPHGEVPVAITDAQGKTQTIITHCQIHTENELTYYQHGGILSYVLRTR